MGISLPNNRPCRSARSSSPPSTTRCCASGRSRSPYLVSSTPGHCWHHPRRCRSFLEYGLWQDYGTGRETPRGNPGDIGRAKKRKRRRWFSRKYYASVMNLREFLEENLGREFCGILSSALSKDFRQNH